MKTVHTITITSEKLQEYVETVQNGRGEFVAGILIGQLMDNLKVEVEKDKEVE